MRYNPYDHYWHVAGDQTQAFHSGRRAFVATADATFVAWRGNPEHAATQIDTLANLREVLAPYGLSLSGEKPATRFDDDPRWRILFEWAFAAENRIRTLQGQGTVTRAQFLNAIRDLAP